MTSTQFLQSKLDFFPQEPTRPITWTAFSDRDCPLRVIHSYCLTSVNEPWCWVALEKTKAVTRCYSNADTVNAFFGDDLLRFYLDGRVEDDITEPSVLDSLNLNDVCRINFRASGQMAGGHDD
jgi:hypothetical protein